MDLQERLLSISEEGEVWLPCPEFEDKYMVSSHGRMISIGTYNTCKKNGLLLQHKKKGRNGYMQVRLQDNGRAKTFETHVLVARAFIPNPEGLPMVNHKDENKTNNHVENLEWCTSKYNTRYSKAKAIDVYTKEGEFIETLECISDAKEKYKLENIRRCCNTKYGTCGDYQFRYKGEPFQKRPFVFTEYKRRKERRGHSCNEGRFIPINVYSKTGQFLESFKNLSEAAKVYKTTTSNICKCYKGKILTNKGVIFLLDKNIEQRLQQIKNRKLCYQTTH